MRGRVRVLLALVVPAGHDLTGVDECDDRADGDVAVLVGCSRFVERDAHQLLELHAVHARQRTSRLGGGSGIRTHGELPHTRFPSVPIRPLSHPSGYVETDRAPAVDPVAARRTCSRWLGSGVPAAHGRAR